MQTLKLILEICYYLSSIALVIIAAIGLKQISVAKETRQITSKREAFRIAAEQCNHYLEKIIPAINNLNQVITDKNLDYFTKSLVEIENGKISLTPYTENNTFRKSIESSVEEIMIATNLLEGFSLYFVSGVASEIVGFNTLGKTFVNSVRGFLPYYVPVSEDGSYKHTLELFVTWHTRIENEGLNREKEKIEKKILSTKTISINPIGTD